MMDHVLNNNRAKFPKAFFSFVRSTNRAAMGLCERQLLSRFLLLLLLFLLLLLLLLLIIIIIIIIIIMDVGYWPERSILADIMQHSKYHCLRC